MDRSTKLIIINQKLQALASELRGMKDQELADFDVIELAEDSADDAARHCRSAAIMRCRQPEPGEA